MDGKIIIARKRSADPAQEHLREQKDLWNKSTKDLIAKIIAFKRGLNGRGDPHAGLPPSNIKEPLPAQIGQYLNNIAGDYVALIDGAEKIISEQDHYSQIRRKTQPQMASQIQPAAADDGNFADDGKDNSPPCLNCGKKNMKYDDGRDAYVCHACDWIGPNGPAIKTASWPGSRFWASYFGVKNPDRPIIKNMLRTAVSFREKLEDMENYLSSSDPNSIPRALYITTQFGIGPYKNLLENFDKLRMIHGRDLVTPEPPKKEDEAKKQIDGPIIEDEVPPEQLNRVHTMNNLMEIQKDIPNLQSVVNYYIGQPEVSLQQKTTLKALKGAANKGAEISIYINKLKQGLPLAELENQDAEKIILAYRKLLSTISQITGYDSLNFGDYAKKIQEQPIEVVANNALSRFLKRKWLQHKPDFIRADVDIDMRKEFTIERIHKIIKSLENFMNTLEKNESIDAVFSDLKEISKDLADMVEDIITLAEAHTSMYRDENRSKRKGLVLQSVIEREINKLRSTNEGIRQMSRKILIHRPRIGVIQG